MRVKSSAPVFAALAADDGAPTVTGAADGTGVGATVAGRVTASPAGLGGDAITAGAGVSFTTAGDATALGGAATPMGCLAAFAAGVATVAAGFTFTAAGGGVTAATGVATAAGGVTVTGGVGRAVA